MNYTDPDQHVVLTSISPLFINSSLSSLSIDENDSAISDLNILAFIIMTISVCLFSVTLSFCRTMRMVTKQRRTEIKSRSSVRRLSDSTMKRRQSMVWHSSDEHSPRKSFQIDNSVGRNSISIISTISYDEASDSVLMKRAISPVLLQNSREDELQDAKRRRSLRRFNSLNSSRSDVVTGRSYLQHEPIIEDEDEHEFMNRISLTWSKKKRSKGGASESGEDAFKPQMTPTGQPTTPSVHNYEPNEFMCSLPRQQSDNQSNTVGDSEPPHGMPKCFRQRSQSLRVSEAGSSALCQSETTEPENDVNIDVFKDDPAKADPSPLVLIDVKSAPAARRATICTNPSQGRPRYFSYDSKNKKPRPQVQTFASAGYIGTELYE